MLQNFHAKIADPNLITYRLLLLLIGTRLILFNRFAFGMERFNLHYFWFTFLSINRLQVVAAGARFRVTTIRV